MILSSIAQTILGWLSFAHEKIGPSLAELKQTVLANDLALEKEITEFEALGFHTLSEFGRLQFDPYRKYHVAKFMEIPANVTVDDLNADYHIIYRWMIERSKHNSIYSNAAQITDLLKTDALYIGVMRNNSDSNDDMFRYVPPLEEIVDKVLKVIQEEKGVLVNGRFVKPNSELDSLYRDLERIARPPNILYFQVIGEMLNEKCALPTTGCSIELRNAIHTRMMLKEKAKSLSPIDSKLKVDKLLEILPASRKANNEIFDALQAANPDCLFRMTKNACNKRSDY